MVRYGTDPSYTLLSDPVNGPLNSMFQLPLLEPTTTYYLQTSVLINSTLTVQVQEKFTTGECKCTHIHVYTPCVHSFFIHAVDPRLLDIHIGLIIAGAIFWMLAMITVIISSILLKVAKYPSSCKYLMATISTPYLGIDNNTHRFPFLVVSFHGDPDCCCSDLHNCRFDPVDWCGFVYWNTTK